MTILSVTHADGTVSKCDSRCYNATGPVCNCPCGGKNHQKGIKEAIQNTMVDGQKMIAEFRKEHPDIEDFFITAVKL